MDGAGEYRAGMGIMHDWDPPLCWAGHLIYTYSSPLPKQGRYDHLHFPGKKPEVQSPVCPSLP